MSILNNLLQSLRIWGRMPAGDLLARLQVSRATMMRAVKALGNQVVVRGKARRTVYAARLPIRGNPAPIPLYQINDIGQGQQVGQLDPLYPAGSALDFAAPFDWPLIDDMVDGWFKGIPYPLDDMRPQGFLGRNFARRHAMVLGVPEDPWLWSDEDVLHALSLLGSDFPGNYILGDAAYQLFLAEAQNPSPFMANEDEILQAYLRLAHDALSNGNVGSSAAGEFPKFTARRMLDGEPAHVMVKFSGADNSEGTQRWADLLVCEHLALEVIADQLQIESAKSRIYQTCGRTFLEVRRFDRHGKMGRSPVCTWAAVNAAMFGIAGDWRAGAAAMRAQGLLTAADEQNVQRIWHFGRLIANNDMHDGNLAFRPGLRLAPVYDMLPMLYAPIRGVKLPEPNFTPSLPVPAQVGAWRSAANAAAMLWERAAQDARISEGFRRICAENAAAVRAVMENPIAAVL